MKYEGAGYNLLITCTAKVQAIVVVGASKAMGGVLMKMDVITHLSKRE